MIRAANIHKYDYFIHDYYRKYTIHGYLSLGNIHIKILQNLNTHMHYYRSVKYRDRKKSYKHRYDPIEKNSILLV